MVEKWNQVPNRNLKCLCLKWIRDSLPNLNVECKIPCSKSRVLNLDIKQWKRINKLRFVSFHNDTLNHSVYYLIIQTFYNLQKGKWYREFKKETCRRRIKRKRITIFIIIRNFTIILMFEIIFLIYWGSSQLILEIVPARQKRHLGRVVLGPKIGILGTCWGNPIITSMPARNGPSDIFNF